MQAIEDPDKKHEQKRGDGLTLKDFMPKKADKSHDESAEDANDGDAGDSVVNLQKRDYALDATRYGDWELNGRCVDF